MLSFEKSQNLQNPSRKEIKHNMHGLYLLQLLSLGIGFLNFMEGFFFHFLYLFIFSKESSTDLRWNSRFSQAWKFVCGFLQHYFNSKSRSMCAYWSKAVESYSRKSRHRVFPHSTWSLSSGCWDAFLIILNHLNSKTKIFEKRNFYSTTF